MCFYADYDWYAGVVERSERIGNDKTRCDECCRVISVGTPYLHVDLQEREVCRRCEDGECECPACDLDDGHECQCPEPAIGESCSYDHCDDCRKFLQAVEAAEVEAGCSASEAVPPVGEMVQSIRDGGFSEAKKYFRNAKAMFPELVGSGYLAFIIKKMFRR